VSPDQTAPSTQPPHVAEASKPLPGFSQKAKISPHCNGNRRRTGLRCVRRRESRRGRAADGRNRNSGAGVPTGAPARQSSKFSAENKSALFARPPQLGNGARWPIGVNGEPTANGVRSVERPQSTPPTNDVI
jgi:hypothetical protein